MSDLDSYKDKEIEELRLKINYAKEVLKDLRWGLFNDIQTVEGIIDAALVSLGENFNMEGYFDYKKNMRKM